MDNVTVVVTSTPLNESCFSQACASFGSQLWRVATRRCGAHKTKNRMLHCHDLFLGFDPITILKRKGSIQHLLGDFYKYVELLPCQFGHVCHEWYCVIEISKCSSCAWVVNWEKSPRMSVSWWLISPKWAGWFMQWFVLYKWHGHAI